MRTYIYRDRRGPTPQVVFKCQARDILAADKLYEKKTGSNPAKQPYVGCEILPARKG